MRSFSHCRYQARLKRRLRNGLAGLRANQYDFGQSCRSKHIRQVETGVWAGRTLGRFYGQRHGTIGKLRQNVQQLELHIKQLEDDSLSSAPDLNTQIALLNKINAANVLLVRTMQDTNKLLA